MALIYAYRPIYDLSDTDDTFFNLSYRKEESEIILYTILGELQHTLYNATIIAVEVNIKSCNDLLV